MFTNKYIYKTDFILIVLAGLILFLNAARPWLDFIFPINIQLITAFQFLILLLFITILDSSFYKKTDLISAVLITFILIIFFSQTILHILSADIAAIVSGLYVVLRTFLIVYLFQILLSHHRDKHVFIVSQKFLLIYFLITFFYSLLQHPQIFNLGLLREYGGNFTSANQLVSFRANGAIGGTVIDYANFLLAVSWVLFFSHFEKKETRNWLIIIFFIVSFLAFSRALYVCLFFMLMVHLISFKNIIRSSLSIILVSIPILLLIIYFDVVLEIYNAGFNASDIKRVNSWKMLFENFTFLEYILGKELGGNTGLFLSGGGKISGDGFITGFMYDAGIILSTLLYLLITLRVFSISINFKASISILGSLFLMLIINSGFEKLFIVFVYVLAIAIIHGTSQFKNSHMPSEG